MRILIYGGSFNPPHLGHVRAAQTAAQTLAADRTFLIPAAEPPHKQLAENSPAPADRLEMTRLAAESIDGAAALDIELLREGKSYTSDTLRELKRRYPGDELVFLLGTDMLITLPDWHEPAAICSLASIAVFARETGREAEIAAAADRLRGEYGAVVHIVPGEPVTISSTALRACLRERQGREYLTPAVYAYIIRRRLYGAKPDFAWLRQEAYAYLKPKRVTHVQGVEAEAVKLAARWGVPADDAAEAAICHDITKKLSQDEQLRLCDKYGIMTDAAERASEKLLHSRTGAALAGELFGLSDEVKSAIRWHTTGRPGMTALEKITYLADYIEPNRSGFPGLEELRRACYEDLDLAMELAMRMSLDEVRGRGQEPHVYTADGWRYYRNALRERGLAPVRAADIPDNIDF